MVVWTTQIRKASAFLCAAIIFVAISGTVGYCAGAKRAVSVTHITVAAADDALKARLLTEAMDYVGVCSPEAAADVWVQGLMRRSAAMQYGVMDDTLKARYAKALEKTAPSWVTGTSSPWVSQYTITRQEQTAPDTAVITLNIDTATSTGPAQTLRAVLAIAQYGDFWRITSIEADEALQAYMGFNP